MTGLVQRLWASTVANFFGKALLSMACAALIAADPGNNWEQPADSRGSKKTAAVFGTGENLSLQCQIPHRR